MCKVFSEREAKEYLVSKIVDEARRRRVRISEIERRMLFFSETGWSLPDIVDVVAEFERHHDASKFEHKVIRLIEGTRERMDTNEARRWNEARACLQTGDHYLEVLIDRAGSKRTGDIPWRVWATVAVLMSGGFLFLVSVDWYLGRTARRDERAFFAWAAAMVVAIAYTVLRGIFGPRAVDGLIARVTDRLWPVRRP